MIKIEFIRDKWFLCECKCLDNLYKVEAKKDYREVGRETKRSTWKKI